MGVCDRRGCTNYVRPGAGLLCDPCVDRLVGALRTLYLPGENERGEPTPTLVEEVRTTLYKQGKTAKARLGVSVRAGDQPSAMGNRRAAQALDGLRACLATWIRELWTVNMPDGGAVRCGATIESMAEWLALRPAWIAEFGDAADLYEDVMHAVGYCWRVIDRPPAALYRGACSLDGCAGDVFARPESSIARCYDCGAEYDSGERKAWLLRQAMKLTLTAAEMAKALPALMDRPLSVQTIHTWARDGRLQAVDRTDRGWPRYRVSAVVDLALSTHVRAPRTSRHADELAGCS